MLVLGSTPKSCLEHVPDSRYRTIRTISLRIYLSSAVIPNRYKIGFFMNLANSVILSYL